MKRESMVFYRSWYDAILKLPAKKQIAAFRALFDYGYEGIETESSPEINMMLDICKPQIDANNKRFENGRKGGAPKGNNNANKEKNNLETTKNNQKQPRFNQNQPKNNQKQPNVYVYVNENENVNVNEDVNDNASEYVVVNEGGSGSEEPNSPDEQNNNNTKGKKPLIHEIKLELLKLGAQMDDSEINAFMDYNDERGWRLNWQYALKRWVDNQKQKPEDMHSDDFWDSLLKGET